MSEKLIGIGVVGAGYWGPNIIRNFSSIDSCRLISVCDLDSEKLKKVKEKYPAIEATNSFDELLKKKEINAIAIASFPSTHYELSKKALLAGKHVFCEKPLTLNHAESEELAKIAIEKNLTLMVGHTYVYSPAVIKLKQLIDSKKLGKIFYIYIRRLNLGLFQKDTNVLWDLAPHDISIVLFLLNSKPVSVSAMGYSHIIKNVEDVAFINIKFENGIFCNIHDSWLDPCKVRETVVVGSKQMAVFDDTEPLKKIKVFERSVDKHDSYESFGEFQLSYNYGDIHIPKIASNEPLKLELEHFIECINSKKIPLSNGSFASNVVRIIEAAQKSIKNNGLEVKF
ncbi:MAG: Gfo/Idh/MocA family oxidoreductase [archaeon]|nr:Gfo/Idh/MocA family oxidoreductase [archaeon]